MHRMRSSGFIVMDEEMSEETRKSQRMNQEICQRFVRLSCHKMISSRGCANLRRNLLILHLLQKARKDMKQVPAECQSLLKSDEPVRSPPSLMTVAAMRRSAGSGSRSGSPISSRSAKPPLGRSLQLQQTTPKRWPSAAAQRPTAIRIDPPPATETKPAEAANTTTSPQPTTPPPLDNAFLLVKYHQNSDGDDVFAEEDEEKENSKREDDVEELFLQKVGKSPSPPVSPEKPVVPEQQKLTNEEPGRKPKSTKTAGRRLEFPLPDVRNTSRNFFGIALPDTKPASAPPNVLTGLSDAFTGQIRATPASGVKEEPAKDLPPYLFYCGDSPTKQQKPARTKTTEDHHRTVPTRSRTSVSMCLESGADEDLKESDDCCVTDGDYTEEEDEEEETTEFVGHRLPSFKRRLRKRAVRNATACFLVAEKRSKDDLLHPTDLIRKSALHDEHCVPSISI